MQELLFIFIVVCGLLLVFLAKSDEQPAVEVVIKPKPKPKKKQQSNPMLNEAKNTLVAFGYTATEAKKMLSGISANTVEQYVNEAMKRVKI